MLPTDHPLVLTEKLLAQTFSARASDSAAFMVSIVWGVKGLDRSNVSLWDPNDLGTLEWDETFTIKPPENYKALLDLCNDLRDNSPLVKQNEVICWIHDFDEFSRAFTKGRLQVPVERTDYFDRLMQEFLKTEKGQLYVN